jgi:hypothetical protein
MYALTGKFPGAGYNDVRIGDGAGLTSFTNIGDLNNNVRSISSSPHP